MSISTGRIAVGRRDQRTRKAWTAARTFRLLAILVAMLIVVVGLVSSPAFADDSAWR
jgi:hypothetical protein